MNGVRINFFCFAQKTGQRECDIEGLSIVINNYGGAELKGYLNEGLNTEVIKVAIGKNGDAIARFKTLASCPTNCTVTGINECTTLEARAQ